MSHFYITLPSDSSANYYPDNTLARFVTKLPERIRLEGEYEMGLAEIIYLTLGTTSTTKRENTGSPS
jgi:hypothetical protein